MRAIDGDALIKKAYDEAKGMAEPCDVFGALVEWLVGKSPTIEPERKKGKWIGTEYDGYADGYPVYYEWKCSACGCVIEDDEPTWNFCPNCGASMREEGEQDE